MFFSCTRESAQNTHTKATFINKSNHLIKILFYKSGFVYSSDTIKLSLNDSLLFAEGNIKGLRNAPGFISKYAGGPDDSVIVIFDNLYKVSHYANEPIQKAAKYYLNSSLRNVVNPNSYRFVSTDFGNDSRLNEHFYTFSEQDYLDAR